MTLDDVLDKILAEEGGYVNDPNDAGGETNYGITIAVARQQGYDGPMKAMPIAFARDVYRRRYVVAPGFDKVVALSMPIAAEVIDTGVNMGVDVAARFLQRALTALNRGGQDYPDLAVDGHAGAFTIAALRAYLLKRGAEGERRLLKALNALQGERYVSLTEARGANEAFLYGWLDRV